MRLLLDTHAWLWFYLGDKQLSGPAQSQISDPANIKLISPASYWELAIKISLGKYVLNEPFDDFIQHAIADNGFLILPIEPRHTARVATLPYFTGHYDPFDRLIVAQSLVEKMPIISADLKLDAYGISRIW